MNRVILLLLSLAACDPAALSTAKTVSSDVSSAISVAPSACSILSAAGARVGTACSSVATDASDVAKLVSDIIASLPSGAKGLQPASTIAIKVKAQSGGMVDLTLPIALAAQVQAALAQ